MHPALKYLGAIAVVIGVPFNIYLGITQENHLITWLGVAGVVIGGSLVVDVIRDFRQRVMQQNKQ